jgi:hypothetical protein
MKKTKIDIQTGILFPWHFQLIAVIVLAAGLVAIIEKPILSVILLTGSLFILTGRSGVIINRSENVYQEYMSFFFIKNGKKIRYTGVEKIFINTSKVSHRMYTAHTSHSSIFSQVEFNAYLKLDNGVKVHLASSRKKEKLLRELTKISSFLNAPLEDNTAVPA